MGKITDVPEAGSGHPDPVGRALAAATALGFQKKHAELQGATLASGDGFADCEHVLIDPDGGALCVGCWKPWALVLIPERAPDGITPELWERAIVYGGDMATLWCGDGCLSGDIGDRKVS